MKSTWSWALLLGIGAAAFADDAPKVEYKPLSIAALQEFGQLRSGQFGKYPEVVKDEWVDHFGAFLTQSVVVDDALTINVGLGGLFEFQKREEISPAWGGSQTKYFFVGPTVADVTYQRPTSGGSWSLGAGMFGYKYNPDAANLGEYLLRTGAYPTIIFSGGYAFVNNSGVFGLEGMKANYTLGGFSADALILTETTLAPLYDLSLVTLFKYKTPGGLFSAFGGANFKSLIPVRPSLTNRKVNENSYFRNPRDGSDPRWYTGHRDYYREQSQFYGRKLREATTFADSTFFLARKDSLENIQAMVSNKNNDASKPGWLDSATGLAPGAQFYSLQSVITTLGAALDFKSLFGADFLGPQDLRLYFEAALLGLKDYPLFYEKKAQRMPVMVGFNLPGFKLLDLVSIQYEWFDSPWINSYETRGSRQIAVPAFGNGGDPNNSKDAFNDAAARDNTSWSLLIRKDLFKGMSLSAQAARDHIRAVSLQTYGGPGTDPNEVLTTSKDWYWMLQFSVGI